MMLKQSGEKYHKDCQADSSLAIAPEVAKPGLKSPQSIVSSLSLAPTLHPKKISHEYLFSMSVMEGKEETT